MASTNKEKPVLNSTLTYLREFIRARGLPAGARLPALRKLAAEVDVSLVTMFRAMRELKASGEVTLVNNHSYFVSQLGTADGGGAHSGGPVASGTGDGFAPEGIERHAPAPAPWERAAHRIRQDIVNRVYRPGATLPSVKETRTRYGISFRTVKKALTQLVEEGTLERTINGGFAVPSFALAGWRPKIVCINQSSDSYNMGFGQNDEAVYRALELLCEQAGISIEVILLQNVVEDKTYFLRNKATGAIVSIDDVSGSDGVLGFLYMIQLAPTEFDVAALQRLLLRKKPVVVLDETSLLELPVSPATSRFVRVITAAVNSEPGSIVGRHLMALGHRRIAFISMDHQATWSRRRLDGLNSSYEAAGFGGAVVPFVMETYAPQIVEQAGKRCKVERFLGAYHAWRKGIPADYRTDSDPAMEHFRWEICSHAEVRSLVRPILEKALADAGVTAWVLVNDNIASMASDFLKSKGIRIPADLSIISFDDTPESLRKGYSSFNFNAAAVAESLVGFLLGRKLFTDARFKVNGSIVNRGTTGPVHTRTDANQSHSLPSSPPPAAV